MKKTIATLLTPLQNEIAHHYCGGDMAWVTKEDEIKDCGDTLFAFLLYEAADADGDRDEFLRMLDIAIAQLRSLKGEME